MKTTPMLHEDFRTERAQSLMVQARPWLESVWTREPREGESGTVLGAAAFVNRGKLLLEAFGVEGAAFEVASTFARDARRLQTWSGDFVAKDLDRVKLAELVDRILERGKSLGEIPEDIDDDAPWWPESGPLRELYELAFLIDVVKSDKREVLLAGLDELAGMVLAHGERYPGLNKLAGELLQTLELPEDHPLAECLTIIEDATDLLGVHPFFRDEELDASFERSFSLVQSTLAEAAVEYRSDIQSESKSAGPVEAALHVGPRLERQVGTCNFATVDAQGNPMLGTVSVGPTGPGQTTSAEAVDAVLNWLGRVLGEQSLVTASLGELELRIHTYRPVDLSTDLSWQLAAVFATISDLLEVPSDSWVLTGRLDDKTGDVLPAGADFAKRSDESIEPKVHYRAMRRDGGRENHQESGFKLLLRRLFGDRWQSLTAENLRARRLALQRPDLEELQERLHGPDWMAKLKRRLTESDLEISSTGWFDRVASPVSEFDVRSYLAPEDRAAKGFSGRMLLLRNFNVGREQIEFGQSDSVVPLREQLFQKLLSLSPAGPRLFDRDLEDTYRLETAKLDIAYLRPKAALDELQRVPFEAILEGGRPLASHLDILLALVETRARARLLDGAEPDEIAKDVDLWLDKPMTRNPAMAFRRGRLLTLKAELAARAGRLVEIEPALELAQTAKSEVESPTEREELGRGVAVVQMRLGRGGDYRLSTHRVREGLSLAVELESAGSDELHRWVEDVLGAHLAETRPIDVLQVIEALGRKRIGEQTRELISKLARKLADHCAEPTLADLLKRAGEGELAAILELSLRAIY
jgi:hypothetical protein